jgi:adenylate cyclase
MVYTGLGEKEKAFEWLDRAFQEHDQPLGFIKTAVVWDSLRSDPRYTALLQKMGLEK